MPLIAAEDDLHRATITRAQVHEAAKSALEALRTGERLRSPLARAFTYLLPVAGANTRRNTPRNNRMIPRGQRALGR